MQGTSQHDGEPESPVLSSSPCGIIIPHAFAQGVHHGSSFSGPDDSRSRFSATNMQLEDFGGQIPVFNPSIVQALLVCVTCFYAGSPYLPCMKHVDVHPFPLLYSSRSILWIFIQHAGHLHGISIVFICALQCLLCHIYTSLETYSTAKGAAQFVSTNVCKTRPESRIIIPATYKGRAEHRWQARRRRSERRGPPAA
jgi:hypothetical protein